MPPTDSLRTLLSGVIDYAGLFPPAALPLDLSIRNYARYQGDDTDRWMLGRFICPAARLLELQPYLDELFTPDRPLSVSALGSGGADDRQFAVNLARDLEAVAVFRDTAGPRAGVDVLETRIPASAADSRSTLLGDLAARCRDAGLRPFCEVSLAADWAEAVPRAVEAIARHPGPGFKLRTGGVEASAFPSPAQVALAITACRDAGIPLKFTAGLHHPLRHFSESVDAKMHGFLNVFAACVFARVHKLDAGQVEAILADESAASFTFPPEGLAWGDLCAATAQIAAARRELAISFGSCSFDEPRQDLRVLGLL